MIQKVSVDNKTSINSAMTHQLGRDSRKKSPNFEGIGALAISGIQACEKMPMANVAVIDFFSAILPRTIVESMTNWFAGFEALRRESSGLIVNCIIPGGVTYLIASAISPMIMPKGSNLSSCWADRSLIDKASEYYKNAKSEDKVYESLKNILGNIKGYNDDKAVLFKDCKALSKEDIEKYAKELTKISRKKSNGKEVSAIADKIVEKTHVSENIKIIGEKEVKASSVKTLLSDSVEFFREFQKVPEDITIEQFAKSSKKLVMAKSLIGLGVILPLAISMQYINRWITSKVSGVKGAPIYEDFGKEKNNIEENPKAKKGLLKQKIISISSMIGIALLSMMKKPTLGMLEFTGKFPTMDQARIISTSTFASRMAASEDKNELAESTMRDIATFCGLYFFGDYAAKATATLLQKKTGVILLNKTKSLKKGANIIDKFIHWVKDVNIKSSEEVVGKTAKEIKYAQNLRTACQAANLGVSLLLLGIIIPIFTRRNTKKKHEQALKRAQHSQSEKNLQKKSDLESNVSGNSIVETKINLKKTA